MKKILVSGIQPTGRPHLGNYFGAIKQFIELQKTYDSRIFIANLHALTTNKNPHEIMGFTKDTVLDLISAGINPDDTTLYLQSDIPHVTELTWIFNCLVSIPYLHGKSHAYKTAILKYGGEIMNNKEQISKISEGVSIEEMMRRVEEVASQQISVGTFDYPILMSADILVHDANVVPVGQDQQQHLEVCREIAEKFNRTFGQTFKIPESLIFKDYGTINGTDGRKMSKSYKNTIPLFASDSEIETLVMGIVTDSKANFPINVYNIHLPIHNELIKQNKKEDTTLADLYEKKSGNYKELKLELIKDLKAFITPMREKRKEWEGKPDEVKKIITEGGMKMRKVVHEKMVEVRKKVGLIHHE